MRRNGAPLPWQTCMKPANRPFWTCSPDATVIQFDIMIYQVKQLVIDCHLDLGREKYNHKARRLDEEPC